MSDVLSVLMSDACTKMNELRAEIEQLRAERDALREANDSLVRWKGEIDQRRMLLNLQFPDDYDNSPKYAINTLIQAEIEDRPTND